ncbi:MAG TPA: integrase family protein [Tianweitania sediminis]|jgi:integrase|nr:integrase family protein [Tianweitania sediminis]
MPSARFTKTVVDQLPFTERGQLFIRDSQLKGFGLRVGTQAKTYFVEGQVKRRTVRVTIGRADIIPVDAARKRAMAILGQMAEGIDPNLAAKEKAARDIILSDAFDAFFASKRALSPRTVDGYSRSRDLYLGDWTKRPMVEITRQMVLARHQKIAEERGRITANNVMRHLRSVYNFTAAAHEEFPPNPVTILTQARAWHREQRRRTLLTPKQLPAWWRAVMSETEDARDVLLVALFTGMRRTEVTSLRWDYLDFASATLTLPKTKNGDPLQLPMSDFLANLLSARRELVGQSEWVFPSRSAAGHIMETKSFTRRVSAASGVEFSMHDLRRTFVTIAESLDVPAYALKALLNHRTDRDVTGGYIVISADRLRTPVQAIALKLIEVTDGRSFGE